MTHTARLASLVEADFVSAWWLLAEASGAELHDEPELRWYASGVADRHLNSVLATRLADDRADAAIEALLADLRNRDVPFLWWVLPSSSPGDLGERLTARGLEADDAWPAMAVSIEGMRTPPPVRGLEIRRVVDVASLRVYSDVYAPIMSPSPAFTELLFDASQRIGFDADAPEVSFVGYLDGRPVATASLVTAGGAAGIYNVSTVPEARGRGIGAAMTAAAVMEGSRRGMTVASLQASRMGRPVYERLGFRHVADFVPYRVRV